MQRPPVWESFKVEDIPTLVGTRIGDFEIVRVYKENNFWRVAMVCSVCGKQRDTTIYDANRAAGRCKHGGAYYVD